MLAETTDIATRIPYFCSGCPHNSSTVVPKGMRAYAGIGCHYMVQWMDRDTLGLHPDGRRGRQLGRRGAVLQAPARVPEPRRRHLQPLRLDGDPRRDRGRHQHHLQDPVQRRGRDDRRAGERRRPHGAADRARRWRPRARSASSSSPTSRRNIPPAPSGRMAWASTTATSSTPCSASWPRSRAARC